ncbi:MAG: S-adenosylmethionine:tRNA ribosyltransferase-isomerase [Paludibacteraceae bacterium]|nr:S-adenosylmethionine:tRNA ribosyltransferase-isomerase [Paludibacteraceae bacterium]
MNIKEIRIEDFDYALPDERIAKYPLEERDSSNLLYWRNGAIEKMHFYDLPDLLSREHLLIYNNTKVIQARLHFQKETGATIEIFCLEPHSPADYNLVFQENKSCVWKCLVGNSKKWKEGALKQTMSIRNILFELRAVRIESANEGMSHLVRFEWDNEDILFSDILSHFGELPIPPYLNRATEEKDKETYQTVYSKIDGSVAAPTAGLHFTKDVLRRLALNGVREDEVTLHVGAGTFQPVKSEEIGDHPMHREIISVSKRVIEDLIASEGHVVAVGTTSVRTLESLYYLGCRIARNPENPDLMVEQWEPYENDYTLTTREALQTIVDYLNRNHLAAINAATRIMIVPSFQFRVVNKIITNFHQPKSTLLLLISAFVGIDRWRAIYEFAMANDFRFLSYGDSSLLERN